MNRREFLGAVSATGVGATAGCSSLVDLDGSNPNLVVVNESSEAVTLSIRVEQVMAGGRRIEDHEVFDEDVTVPGGDQRVLRVLGNGQYWIHASGIGQAVEFPDRPICDRARTSVVVTADGELTFELVDCE